MLRANIGGPRWRSAPPRRRAWAGSCTSSAATIGGPKRTIGREDTPPRLVSTRALEDRGRAGSARDRQSGRCRRDLPSICSVQGPGRASSSSFLLAFLDGRLKLFVVAHVSLVDIKDCTAEHLLAARRGTPGERYILSGVTLPRSPRPSRSPRGSWASSAARGSCRAARTHDRRLEWSNAPSGSCAATRRCAGRWCGRWSTGTATTAPRRARSSGCATADPRDHPTDGHMGARWGLLQNV